MSYGNGRLWFCPRDHGIADLVGPPMLNSTVTSAVATATVPYSGHRRLNPSTSAAPAAESVPYRSKSSLTAVKSVTS